MFRESFLIELIGWFGVAAVLLAYALSSLGMASSQSLLCIALNLIGAAGIALVSYFKHNWQSVVLNIVWAGIALVALSSLLL